MNRPFDLAAIRAAHNRIHHYVQLTPVLTSTRLALRVAWFVVFLFLALVDPGRANTSSKPNIVLFIADDWGRNASCYRDVAHPDINDVISTPNIDRLAHEGVLFRNAFYNVSSCTPSRASIATGCYFWRLGRNALHGMEPEWKSHAMDPGWSLPGLGTILQSQNYFLSSWGKTLHRHWFPAERFPFDSEKVRYSQWVLTQSDQAAAEKEIEAIIRASVLQMLAKRKNSQPFFHAIGPANTHRPFAKGSGKSLWKINPDDLIGKLPAFLPDIPEVREDMADGLGEVLALDRYIGWIVDELRKSGELDSTMLVLTGDNGISMPRGKTNVYDLGMRAPLIICWPAGVTKGGRVIDEFVSLVDLAPTFLEAAGATIPANMNGRSLVPLLKSDKSGQIDSARNFVVMGRERHDGDVRNGLPYPVRAIRTPEFLYVRNFKPERWPCGEPTEAHFPSDPKPDSAAEEWTLHHKEDPKGKALFALYYDRRPAEELYDVRSDPDQMKNLAADPRYAEPRRHLSERLLSVLRESNDPRLTDVFDRPPYLSAARVREPSPRESSDDDPFCIHHANGD